MPSTYTVNLGIEKPATGEQSGTWGDTTNLNFDMLDQAINGAVSITLASAGTSGSPNTLAISDGAVSDGRNKWIEFTDGGDLGATAYVQLTPNDAEKIVFIRNSLSGSRSVILFQGTYDAGRDLEVPAGVDMVVKFSGGGATATTTNIFQRLRVEELNIAGTTTVDGVIDDDTMATASATKLATSESIKAYVDSSVGAQDTLSEILTNGDTTGGNNIVFGDSTTPGTDNTLILGASSDLQLYHSSGNSYVSDAGAGSLKLLSNGTGVDIESAGGETLATFATNGASTLYYNNTARIATTDAGGSVNGSFALANAAAPSLTITDSDTPVTLSFQSTNSLGRIGTTTAHDVIVQTSDTPRMKIDALGDVGFYETDGTTISMNWDASTARLGVGTDTPDRTLHVYSGTLDTIATFQSTDAAANITFQDNTTTSDTTVYIGAVGDQIRLGGTSFELRNATDIVMSSNSSSDVTIGNTGIHYDRATDAVTIGGTLADVQGSVRELNVLGGGNVYLRVETSTTSDFPALELANAYAGKETWTIYNNDADNHLYFNDDSGNRVMFTNTGYVGIGGTPTTPLLIKASESNTTTAIDILKIDANSDGTTGVGFGSSIYFTGERNDGITQAMGRLRFEAAVNAGTDLSSDFVIHTAKAGVSTEALRVDYEGAVIIGTGDSIASEYSLYINNTAPVLAFTDSNTFSDANDRWEIRGSGNGGYGTLETQFWDDSASAMTVYARYRPDILQFNPDAANIDFVVKGDTLSNLFFVDASTDRVAIGTNSPNTFFNVFVGSNNSDIARFTGAQASNGLLISTYSQDGVNDGGVEYNAPEEHRFDVGGTDVFSINTAEVTVRHTTNLEATNFQGQVRNSGNANYSVRLGTVSGTGARVKIVLNGSIGYGSPDFGTIVVECAVGNADDEFKTNMYGMGGSPSTFNTSGGVRIYTDRNNGTSYDVWLWFSTYAKFEYTVIEQSGWTPLFDNSSGTGSSIPGTAVQTEFASVFRHAADTHVFVGADTGAAEFARISASGLSFDVGSNYLDTYEEGNFTVQVSDGTNTFDWDTAYYTKVGRIITISARLTNVPSYSSLLDTTVRFTNLPYPCVTNFSGGAFHWRSPTTATMSLVTAFEENSTTCQFRNYQNVAPTWSDYNSASDCFFSWSYMTSS